MRRTTVAAGLALVSLLPTALGAQWNAPERPIRSWAIEMRDKAERSLYVKHDCRAALAQAKAGYNRLADRHDPRLVLAKARAHQCVGEMAEAVLAYSEYQALSDQERGIPDQEFEGACSALLPATWLGADSVTTAARVDSLVAAHRRQTRLLAQEQAPSGYYVTATYGPRTPTIGGWTWNYSPYQTTAFESGTAYLRALQSANNAPARVYVVFTESRPDLSRATGDLHATEAALRCLLSQQ